MRVGEEGRKEPGRGWGQRDGVTRVTEDVAAAGGRACMRACVDACVRWNNAVG